MEILGKMFLSGIVLMLWGLFSCLFINDKEWDKSSGNIKIILGVFFVLPIYFGLFIMIISGLLIIWFC